MDIAEKVLEFKRQDQEGKGLKTLTPDQMLSTQLVQKYQNPVTVLSLTRFDFIFSFRMIFKGF